MNDVFSTYGLNWLYSLLVNNQFKIEEISDCYYKITGKGTVAFINLREPVHPNVDMRLAIDSKEAYNKIGQVPISIDVFNTTESEVSKWLDFMGSKEGYTYSNSFAYLDDEDRPCVVYP